MDWSQAINTSFPEFGEWVLVNDLRKKQKVPMQDNRKFGSGVDNNYSLRKIL